MASKTKGRKTGGPRLNIDPNWGSLTDAERAEVAQGAIRGRRGSARQRLKRIEQEVAAKARSPKPQRSSLAVFVVGHEWTKLQAIPHAPYLHKVFLPSIEVSGLAENRIYRSDKLLACRADYIGLASMSWNTKYDGKTVWHGRRWPHCLPVERLHELDLSPSVVWCAAITDNALWARDLDTIFPGIFPLLGEIIEHFGFRHSLRLGPLANNYVAHWTVVHALARFMRSAMAYLDRKYGPAWPVAPDRLSLFADRLPAFVGESLSILWWANQTDLTLKQIPPPGQISKEATA